MREGRVTVNGRVETALGTKVDPARDEVKVDGRRVRAVERSVYLLLNKPRGYVSTRRDPQGRKTVLDLVRARDYVYPVGRLDYDSEGLLLLTNDGELAARLTHPRYEMPRTYEVRVRGVPDPAAIAALARGVVLEGQRTRPVQVRLVRVYKDGRGPEAVIEIALHEGRNRQVRRMCEAVGHAVVRLTRVRIGPLVDRSLRPGQYRPLAQAEVRALQRAVGLTRPDGRGRSHD